MTQLYLTMPQPGETITEGTIVEWVVKPGDEVQENEAVAQLETEKAVFEYESPFTGKILKLLHNNGERVKVAEPIAVMDVPEDKAKIYQMMGIAKPVDGSGATPSQPVSPEPAKTSAPVSVIKHEPSTATTVKMSPIVRKLALQNNLSEDVLQKLSVDHGGRITKEAIESYLKGQGVQTKPKATVGPEGEFTAETCSAIRMRIADNMVKSKSKIPHAHNGIAVDVTHIIEYRDKHKDEFKKQNGVSLTFLSLIQPALINAIQKFPMVNASYDDSHTPHQIKLFKHINLGVAVGTEQGLVIPVIKDIGNLSFNDFNAQLNDKIERAQNQKLKPDDLMGGTIIFNNFGFFGTQIGVQVIGYPMAATLGMSVIEKRVVPVDDKIVIRTMCDFILSFDHRVMDGRETGLFLALLKKEVEALKFEHVQWGKTPVL